MWRAAIALLFFVALGAAREAYSAAVICQTNHFVASAVACPAGHTATFGCISLDSLVQANPAAAEGAYRAYLTSAQAAFGVAGEPCAEGRNLVTINAGDYTLLIDAGNVVREVNDVSGYLIVIGFAMSFFMGFFWGWKAAGRGAGRSG